MANEYRISHIGVEVWSDALQGSRVSHVSAETWATYPCDARISHVAVEVWRSVDDVPATAWVPRAIMVLGG